MTKQNLSPEVSALRKLSHFQVRLDPVLAQKLHHYVEARGISANEALRTIVSKFFS